MSGPGNRGKYAETQFRNWAKGQSEKQLDFAFARWPDPHAGSLQTAPSDFEVQVTGVHFKIEVKEVDHAYRLPHKNFKLDQAARMRKWQLAGAASWVLIFFAPASKWRAVPLVFFRDRTGGSWDLTAVPLYPTLGAAAQAIFGGLLK